MTSAAASYVDATQFAHAVVPLMAALYRSDCPDVERLALYQEHRLDSVQQLLVRKHLSDCPGCREELNFMNCIDTASLRAGHKADQLETLPQPARRQLTARQRSGVDMQVLGEEQFFETPHISIICSSHSHPKLDRKWSLTGSARTAQGLRAAGLIKKIFLTLASDLELIQYEGVVESDGTFVFEDIASGMFALRAIMAEDEIIVRPILVGDMM
jgi:hypothetical protein